jgi:hypothetical protein
LVLQCINVVSSNPVEERKKMCQLKDLILILFGLIFRRMYIYIYTSENVQPNSPNSARISFLSSQIVFLPNGIWHHSINPLIHRQHQSLSLTSSALDLWATSAIRCHDVVFYLYGTIYSLPLGSTWDHPDCLGGFRVAQLFSWLCCILLCFAFLHSVCQMYQCLWILDYIFGVLGHVVTIIWCLTNDDGLE